MAIILPLPVQGAATSEDVAARTLALAGGSLRDLVEAALFVETCPDLSVAALEARIRGLPPGTATLVVDAAAYRAPLSGVSPNEGEDYWVRHLTETAARMVAAAREMSSYIVLDSGGYLPVRPVNRTALLGVDDWA